MSLPPPPPDDRPDRVPGPPSGAGPHDTSSGGTPPGGYESSDPGSHGRGYDEPSWSSQGPAGEQAAPTWQDGGHRQPYRQPMSPVEERTWAMAAHLSALVMVIGIPSLVGPLVVWLVKRDHSAFVDDQSKEALNFNLSVLVYAIVGGVIASLLAIVTLGIGIILVVPIVLVAAAAWLVLVIVGAVRASNGEAYRYPLTIRFIS